MRFKQPFLYIAAERGVKAGVAQLVFVMPVFGGDLFQSVHGLVVGIGRGSVVFVKRHYAFRLCLNLFVFGLGGVQLHLVVCRVQFGKQLSCLHAGAVLYIYLLYRAAHSECEADVLCRFYFSGILQAGLPAGGDNRICFYGLVFSRVFSSVATG